MPGRTRRLPQPLVWGVFLLVAIAGCFCAPEKCPPPPVPHELAKVSLPPYVVEPPDILLIDAIRLVPKPPYRIEPLDALGIQVTGTLPEQPIQGIYSVDADGTVNLGFTYGTVSVD